MAEANVLAMRLGPGKHLHDKKILGGDVMDGREFDYFHDMIVGQELVRPAARGFQVSFHSPRCSCGQPANTEAGRKHGWNGY